MDGWSSSVPGWDVLSAGRWPGGWEGECHLQLSRPMCVSLGTRLCRKNIWTEYQKMFWLSATKPHSNLMQRIGSFKQNKPMCMKCGQWDQWCLQLLCTSAQCRGFLLLSSWKGVLFTLCCSLGYWKRPMESPVYDGQGVGLYEPLHPSLPLTLNTQQKKKTENNATIRFSGYRSAWGCGLLFLLQGCSFQSCRKRAKTWCSELGSTPAPGKSLNSQACSKVSLPGLVRAQKSIKNMMDWCGIWQGTLTEVAQG